MPYNAGRTLSRLDGARNALSLDEPLHLYVSGLSRTTARVVPRLGGLLLDSIAVREFCRPAIADFQAALGRA
jgi:hypothetical protein